MENPVEHWKELLVGLGLAIAGAAGGVFATTQANEQSIVTIRDDVTYLRSRVDAIYDRLPYPGDSP
jgi:hypothetical protein